VCADDLAELVPNGELVPMEFRTFGGRKLVLILLAEGKARYQTMVGHSADLTLGRPVPEEESTGQEPVRPTPRSSALKRSGWSASAAQRS
jgi:hypothetical protein